MSYFVLFFVLFCVFLSCVWLTLVSLEEVQTILSCLASFRVYPGFPIWFGFARRFTLFSSCRWNNCNRYRNRVIARSLSLLLLFDVLKQIWMQLKSAEEFWTYSWKKRLIRTADTRQGCIFGSWHFILDRKSQNHHDIKSIQRFGPRALFLDQILSLHRQHNKSERGEDAGKKATSHNVRKIYWPAIEGEKKTSISFAVTARREFNKRKS